jgi:hypothetical protein
VLICTWDHARDERSVDMKRFAASVALAGVLAVTALSPAAARHHYVYARLGAGVCSGLTCTGAFFPSYAAACGAVVEPTITRNVGLVKQLVCPSGLGVGKYLVVR